MPMAGSGGPPGPPGPPKGPGRPGGGSPCALAGRDMIASIASPIAARCLIPFIENLLQNSPTSMRRNKRAPGVTVVAAAPDAFSSCGTKHTMESCRGGQAAGVGAVERLLAATFEQDSLVDRMRPHPIVLGRDIILRSPCGCLRSSVAGLAALATLMITS